MSIEIVPFTEELLSEAGMLLAQRHQRDRTVLPELPPRFEEAEEARSAVEAAWKRPHASGVAAMSGGQLLGYLIGDRVIESIWGRAGWVRLAGCALAPGQSVELIGDLYAVLGAQWMERGCFAHFAMVPNTDQSLVGAWFALCFGIEQVHALMPLTGQGPPAPSLPGLEIRRAGPEDSGTLAELSDVIWRHQVKAPVWGIALPEDDADRRASWAELADDPTMAMWLAFYAGQAVGTQGFFPAEESDDALLIPKHCLYLSVAGTREAWRGRGIGQALTRHGFARAYADGYRCTITNWRSANLQSRRFWTRQGYRPIAYRLVRRIDPRIAWANG